MTSTRRRGSCGPSRWKPRGRQFRRRQVRSFAGSMGPSGGRRLAWLCGRTPARCVSREVCAVVPSCVVASLKKGTAGQPGTWSHGYTVRQARHSHGGRGGRALLPSLPPPSPARQVDSATRLVGLIGFGTEPVDVAHLVDDDGGVWVRCRDVAGPLGGESQPACAGWRGGPFASSGDVLTRARPVPLPGCPCWPGLAQRRSAVVGAACLVAGTECRRRDRLRLLLSSLLLLGLSPPCGS